MFRFFPFIILLVVNAPHFAQAEMLNSPLALSEIYAQQVDRKLSIPPQEQSFYAVQISRELLKSGLTNLPPQYLLLVDRSPQVQAVLLFWLSDTGIPEFIGASPASTGRPNGFDYFETPLGVFDHAAANNDFRAAGTRNGYGVRGYGAKGMRVYDFGWVIARQTWRNGEGQMRLQMHSTDPARLELLLGMVESKGCIRIPATLNRLIDHYGLLDAGYERAMARGKHFWVLPPDREPTPWPGRYLVVVDSNRTVRPDWSPLPGATEPQDITGQSAPSAAPTLP